MAMDTCPNAPLAISGLPYFLEDISSITHLSCIVTPSSPGRMGDSGERIILRIESSDS